MGLSRLRLSGGLLSGRPKRRSLAHTRSGAFVSCQGPFSPHDVQARCASRHSRRGAMLRSLAAGSLLEPFACFVGHLHVSWNGSTRLFCRACDRKAGSRCFQKTLFVSSRFWLEDPLPQNAP